MKLNVIMPMGGGGTRFGNHGFNVPKPLIEIYGKPFFYWATQSLVKNILRNLRLTRELKNFIRMPELM